jgi:hypothetical protein
MALDLVVDVLLNCLQQHAPMYPKSLTKSPFKWKNPLLSFLKRASLMDIITDGDD